jgi:hypothetical protein
MRASCARRVRGGPHLVHAARGDDAIDEGDGGDEDREDDEDGVGGADLGAHAERFVEENLDAGENAASTATILFCPLSACMRARAQESAQVCA